MSEAKDYLAAACKHFDTPQGAVVDARIESDELVMLWDRGINGVAKDRVPLSELKKRRAPAPKRKPKAPARKVKPPASPILDK